jgi:phosphotransferase system  glucose/maltose/N-acetylglucosamine-specific IIC component
VKTVTTFFPAILIGGFAVAVAAGIRLTRDSTGIVGWLLFVVAVVLITWALASLLNLAIFGPVYWLLGKLGHRKKDSQHEDIT